MHLRSILRNTPSDYAYDTSTRTYEEGSHRYDWARIEQELGIRGLPGDYKMLMEGYGPLVIAGIFIVEPDEFAELHEENAGYFRDYPESGAIHPDPGGLLFCATTEGRDTLWWDTTRPDPDRWTMAWQVDTGERQDFDGSLTELLVADLTGRLEPELTGFAIETQRRSS